VLRCLAVVEHAVVAHDATLPQLAVGRQDADLGERVGIALRLADHHQDQIAGSENCIENIPAHRAAYAWSSDNQTERALARSIGMVAGTGFEPMTSRL